jgi:hypothetical protein
VGETYVPGIEKGPEPCIVRRANIEGDFMVELSNGDLVELFAGEADVAEVGWAIDLGDRVSLPFCWSFSQPARSCSTHMLYDQSLQIYR